LVIAVTIAVVASAHGPDRELGHARFAPVAVASVETILGEGVESTVTARTFAVVNFDRDGYIGIHNRTDANGTSGDRQESIDTSGVGARRVYCTATRSIRNWPSAGNHVPS
jgi:hypothetical protein